VAAALSRQIRLKGTRPVDRWGQARAATTTQIIAVDPGAGRVGDRAAARYAPELNPVEGLWSSFKAVELANLTSPTLAEVID
jgi:transposase